MTTEPNHCVKALFLLLIYMAFILQILSIGIIITNFVHDVLLDF